MKKFLSVLTVLFLLAALPAQAMDDNPSGTTVQEVPAEDEMGTNYGTVVTNNADIDDNQGTVETNNHYIDDNQGTVETNNGYIDFSQGTVETNNGYIQENSDNGTVGTNNKDIGVNDGTIETNSSTGSIGDNSGTVNTNNGSITNNLEEGTVETNNGTVKYNYANGTVETNNGTVETNDGTVEINNGKVTNINDLNGGIVKTNNGAVYNGVYNAAQDAIVYTAESIVNYVFRFIDADGEEYHRISGETEYNTTDYTFVTAQDISLPETSKSGYRGKWISETLSGYAGSTLTGVDKAMVFNLIWEKLASEKKTETTQTVETAEATRAADSRDISVSNTFFFMRKPQNFRGITLNGEALVEDEDFTLTAVARNQSDTENTATQIDFTEAFFEKYGEDPLEITLNFVDMEYTLTVTNLADLIQIYEA